MEFNIWTVITVAVILGCMIPILGILASMQEKKIQARGASEDLEAKLDATRAALGAANVRIDEMGERIKVLERIATDPDVELAKSLKELEHEAAPAAG